MAKDSNSLTGNAVVDKAIQIAANGDAKKQEYLLVIGKIESNYNPKDRNPVSGAAGLYQFMPDTAKAYNLKDPYDPVESAKAAVRLMEDNASFLKKKLGREPSNAELYLAHQQGMGGSVKLLQNYSASAASQVGKAAVVQNGGKADMTAGEFSNLWLTKYNKILAACNASTGVTLPSKESVSTVVADLNAHGEKQLAGQLQAIENDYKAQNGQLPESAKKSVAETLVLLKKKTNDIYAQYSVTKTDFSQMLSLHMGPHSAAAIAKSSDATPLNQVSLTQNGKTIKPVQEAVNGFIKEMRDAGIQIAADKNFDSMTAGELNAYAKSFYQINVEKAADRVQRSDKKGSEGLTTQEVQQTDFMKSITQSMGPELGGFMQLVTMLIGFIANGKQNLPTLTPPSQTQGQGISALTKEAQNAVAKANITPLPATTSSVSVPTTKIPATNVQR